jgi:hypothetical protein
MSQQDVNADAGRCWPMLADDLQEPGAVQLNLMYSASY